MRRVTLRDIAESLNLTINTVSQALRGGKKISEQTRERVRQRAEEMGYIPNGSASSLRSGKTYTIAIVFENLVNPYYFIMTDLLDKELFKQGYNLMIFSARYSGDFHSYLDANLAKQILRSNVDGIISFLEPSQDLDKVMQQSKVPLIVISREDREKKYSTILTSDEEGGYLATRHLIENGCRKIAFLMAPQNIKSCMDRFDGYRRALKEFDLPYDENLVIDLDPYKEDTAGAVANALERGIRFDGMFCFNDMFALEMMKFFADRNMRIPEDVAIMGYDDIVETLQMPFPLSTISVDKATVVKYAVEYILGHFNEEKKERVVMTVPVKIVPRLSAGEALHRR